MRIVSLFLNKQVIILVKPFTMNLPECITDDHIDGVVFEGRNKEYGAYVLRKNYVKDLVKSFLIAISGLAALFTLFSFMLQLASDKGLLQEELKRKRDEIIEIKDIFIPSEPKAPAEKKPEEVIKPATTKETTSTMPVLTEEPVKEEVHIPVTPENLPKGPATNGTDVGTSSLTGSVNPPPDTTLFPTIMPEFPGDVTQFIASNLKYPMQAKENGTEGTLFLSFVIDTDGYVSNIKPLRTLGDGCEDAAIKTVKKMPRWKPGRDNNGRAICVRCTLPIRFRLK